MLWLSDEAIEYAVFKCQNNPGYKVGIALNSRSKYNDVELCIQKCLKNMDNYKFCKGIYDRGIAFHNGSYIRIIPATDNSRGYKFHLLITDEEINDKIINCILRPWEILNYVADRHKLSDEEIVRVLDLLHSRILKDKFAEKVSEGEMLALAEVKKLVKCQAVEVCKLEKVIQKQEQFLVEERAQKYDLINKLKRAKSEAYEEFAEKLKEHFDDYSDNGSDETFCIRSEIDAILNQIQCGLRAKLPIIDDRRI